MKVANVCPSSALGMQQGCQDPGLLTSVQGQPPEGPRPAPGEGQRPSTPPPSPPLFQRGSSAGCLDDGQRLRNGLPAPSQRWEGPAPAARAGMGAAQGYRQPLLGLRSLRERSRGAPW